MVQDMHYWRALGGCNIEPPGSISHALPRGKGKYRSTDITKIGVRSGKSYRKNEEISGGKAQIN